jgi:hypothetical protein
VQLKVKGKEQRVEEREERESGGRAIAGDLVILPVNFES